MLEVAVKERIDTWSDRQELIKLGLPVPPPKTMKASSKAGNDEYSPFIDETADLPTIHEAYQYLVKVYVEDTIELKKRNKRAAMKAGAISAFGKDRSKSPQPKNGKRKIKSQKSVNPEEEEEIRDEESLKLMSQIEDLVGTLGVEDPLHTSSGGGSRSRRGSRVPAADALDIEGGGGSRSRRGSHLPGKNYRLWLDGHKFNPKVLSPIINKDNQIRIKIGPIRQ